jgi:tetratricopeptide (TPR) repeat protein
MRETALRTVGYGPADADEVMVAAQEMLAEATGPVARSFAQRNLGRVLAMRGEFEDARRNVYEGNAGLREAGMVVNAAAGSMMAAFVEARAGAPEIAEAALREGIAELDRLKQISYRGTAALLLASLLARRGAYEEAQQWCTEVRASIREEDLTDVIGVNAIEGFLVAERGAHAEGEALTRQALDLVAEIDMYEHRGRSYMWHARTLAIAGKQAEAREAAEAALAIYEAKGDRPAAAWARDLLDSLPA